MNYADFDNEFDSSKMKAEFEEFEKTNGTYDGEAVPLGTYEVEVVQIELKKSKAGKPMVAIRFKIVEGEFKNFLLFYNQVIEKPLGLHQVNNLLKSLDTGVDVGFETFQQYGNMLEEIQNICFADKLSYGLEYGENKGFNTFKITEVIEG